MSVTMQSLGLDKLSQEERLRLGWELVDSVEEDHMGLTAEQWAEVDRRREEFKRDPSTAVEGAKFMSELLRSTAAMRR